MRWIYLSPHLDDAVLSAGGLIYEQVQSGIPVEIWTFMCGDPQLTEYSPFAQSLHAQWGFSSAEETVRARRLEDKSAAAIVGAQTIHFDFLDCIYRRGKNGEWLYSEISVPPHTDDADILRQIADAISARLSSPFQRSERDDPARSNSPFQRNERDDPARSNSPFQRNERDVVLVCQLSVGSHVDHVLVRQAAELLDCPLRYIIDVPYIFYKPHELEAKSVGMIPLASQKNKEASGMIPLASQKNKEASGMKESTHSITETGLERWQEAVLAYRSQFPVLGEAFDTPQKAQESIRSYWAEREGVRLLQYDEMG